MSYSQSQEERDPHFASPTPPEGSVSSSPDVSAAGSTIHIHSFSDISQIQLPPAPTTQPATSASPPESHAAIPGKRQQVKNACTNCQKLCKRCDDARPCFRCVARGIPEQCVDSQRKDRKKGVKRGPYKRRSLALAAMQYEFQLPTPPSPPEGPSSPDGPGPSSSFYTHAPRSPSSSSSGFLAAGDSSEVEELAPSHMAHAMPQFQPPPYPPPSALRGAVPVPENAVGDPYLPIQLPMQYAAQAAFPYNAISTSSPVQQVEELPATYHYPYQSVPINTPTAAMGASFPGPSYSPPAAESHPQPTPRGSPIHHIQLHAPIPQDPYSYSHFAGLPSSSPSSSHSPTHGVPYPTAPYEHKGRRFDRQ